MNGDVHVRFCERLGVKLPGATHQAKSGRYLGRKPIRASQQQLKKAELIAHTDRHSLSIRPVDQVSNRI